LDGTLFSLDTHDAPQLSYKTDNTIASYGERILKADKSRPFHTSPLRKDN